MRGVHGVPSTVASWLCVFIALITAHIKGAAPAGPIGCGWASSPNLRLTLRAFWGSSMSTVSQVVGNPLLTTGHLSGAIPVRNLWGMVRQGDSVLDKTESQIQGWVPQMPTVGQSEPVLAFPVQWSILPYHSSWERDTCTLYLIHINKIYRENSGPFRTYPLNLLSDTF